MAKMDTAQLPALGPCPFRDTISLETDGGENAELINSSIDPGLSIQEIDLPIRKGREAPSEWPEGPRDRSRHGSCSELSSLVVTIRRPDSAGRLSWVHRQVVRRGDLHLAKDRRF